MKSSTVARVASGPGDVPMPAFNPNPTYTPPLSVPSCALSMFTWPTAEHGIAPDHVEGAAFAWLAHRWLAGDTGNLPSVTGARHAVPLGALYRAR